MWWNGTAFGKERKGNKPLYFLAGRIVQFHSLGEDYVHSPAKELGGGGDLARRPWTRLRRRYFANMPWKKVKCNLNYKDKCPGIIYKKDFAKYRKVNRRRAPKKRTEVGSTGVCWTCANAQRSEVSNARRNAGKRSSDAGHQAATAPTVSGSPGPNASCY